MNGGGGGLWDLFQASGVAWFFGVIGRLVFHSREVQAGRRSPFGWHLLWEIPVAIAMGTIGMGIASYLSLPHGWPTAAVVASISYIGPGFIEWAFDTIKSKANHTPGQS